MAYMSMGRLIVLALLFSKIVLAGLAAAEDAPLPPPGLPAALSIEPFREDLVPRPDFLRGTKLTVNLRTYYFNREKVDGEENEAWAFGGWLGYQSGWLLDTLGVGATFYGSAPLYAPENKDGTTLLKPGQAGYYVLGEAYAALRHKTYGVLKGYRQLVEFPELSTPANPFVFPDPTHPYINPQDNRMTPNTFEALTAAGKVGFVRYLTGYLWNIKPRNADDFISMAEQASGTHSDAGVFIGSARLTPMPNLRIDLSEQYGIDTFNTFYAEGVFEYPASLARDWRLRFSAQFTDQRAVGDALVAKAADKYWSTQAGGARLQAIYRETFMLVAGFSITGSGNTIQAPWGAFPGYLSLIDQEFNRANERAALVGAVYDFGEYLPGLNATANFAWGRDAIDPKTRETEPDRREYDLTVEYRPPWLSGLWFRLRGAILDQQGADQLAWQFRLTVNWKMDVLL